MPKLNQKGVIHYALLIAALALIAFIVLASSASFKDKLFSSLYPKPLSHASSNTEFSTSSILVETSCLQNNYIKICFDDNKGGTISSLYDKLDNSNLNLIYPTMGGALQIDLRSSDPITPCPYKVIGGNWGKVWNPTQAGSEASYTSDGGKTWWNVTSDTFNRSLTSTTYHIEFKPRNFYHDNRNDCNFPLPYTTAGQTAEDMYVKEDVQLINDYVKITWNFNHQGANTRTISNADKSKYYRHELPVFYTENFVDCFHLQYQPTANGANADIPFLCKTGNFKVLNLYNSWFSMYDPIGGHEKMTVIGHTSGVDNSLVQSVFQNYSGNKCCNGMQMDFSYYFPITPNMQFTTSAFLTPHLYNDTMASGEKVYNFITNIAQGNLLNSNMQSPTITAPNLLTNGNLGNMQNITVPAGSQNVQWFGNANTPATTNIYTLTGLLSGGFIQADIYVPNNQYRSTAPINRPFFISGKQYFAAILRASSTNSTTFSSVGLYPATQNVQWFGSTSSYAPGNYTICGDAIAVNNVPNIWYSGGVQVDVYTAAGYEKTINNQCVVLYGTPTAFTINNNEYFAVIDRTYTGTVKFSNVTLLKK